MSVTRDGQARQTARTAELVRLGKHNKRVDAIVRAALDTPLPSETSTMMTLADALAMDGYIGNFSARDDRSDSDIHLRHSETYVQQIKGSLKHYAEALLSDDKPLQERASEQLSDQLIQFCSQLRKHEAVQNSAQQEAAIGGARPDWVTYPITDQQKFDLAKTADRHGERFLEAMATAKAHATTSFVERSAGAGVVGRSIG